MQFSTAKHSSSKIEPDMGLRDLSHLTEEEQVEYLIKMTEEEAMIDFRAGVEHKSPGKISRLVIGEKLCRHHLGPSFYFCSLVVQLKLRSRL